MKGHRKNRPVLLTALMLAAVILGCSLPGRPQNTPTPPPDVAPEPMPEVPPTPVNIEANPDVQTRLIAQRPAPGEELPLNGVIELYFNQPMDQASVAEALRFSPDVDFDVEWPSNAAVHIVPTSLDRATTYTLALSETARNTLGNPLAAESRIEVQTVGYIAVSDYVPSSAAPAPTDAPITVFFNQPIVPLTSLDNADTLPDPLRFSPDVPGEGEWIGTSIYRWQPSEPMAASTDYTITVEAGLEDQVGRILPEDAVLTFSTQPVRVENADYETTRSEERVVLNSPLTLTFNQPMDTASTQEAFALQRAGGTVVSGSFEWNDANTVMTFTPAANLAPDATYTLQITDSARDFSGTAPIEGNFSQQITTVPLPAVSSVNPDPGTSAAFPYTDVRFVFNTVMDEDSLYAEDRVTISPEPESTYNTFAYGQGLSINARFQEGVRYTVTLNPGARDAFGNTITEPYTYSFTVRDAPPRVQINLNESFGLYDATGPVDIALVTTNFAEVDLALYAITNVDRAMSDPTAIPQGTPLRTWSVGTEGPRNEAVITPVTVGDDLPLGVYRLVVTNFERFEQPLTHTLIVSNTHVTLKNGFSESLAWVTDLQSGQPITGAGVTLYSRFNESGIQEIGAAETNGDGVAVMPTTSLDQLPAAYFNYSTQRTYAIIEGDGVFGIGLSDWSQDTNPQLFDLPRAFQDAQQTLYLHTDRPLYRPGDTVYFRGVLRDKDDMTFTIPDETVVVTVNGNNFETGEDFRFETTFPVDAFGTFNGEVDLPDDAPLGTYVINVETSGARTDYLAGGPYSYAAGGFRVAEYRKPEFEVLVEPAAGQILDGETFETTITAEYFFGGRVTDAPVSYQIESMPYTFAGREGYTFDDPELFYSFGNSGFTAFVNSGQGSLGPDGTFTLSTEADLGQDALTRRFVIEGTVTDEANQPITGRDDVIVHATETYVGLNTAQRYVNAGDELAVDLLTLGWKGKPVANQPVMVQLYSESWERVRVFDEVGNTTWQWQSTRTPVGDPISLQTDETGEARIDVPIEDPGAYRIVATTEDPNGRVHNASVFTWASGDGFTAWRAGDLDKQLDIITDADSYDPGDTAELLITSPFAGEAQALITVERDGILFNDVITVEGGATTYELDIPVDYAPNVYISVTLYRGAAGGQLPDYRFGLTEITVSPEPRLLDISVTPDRDVIAPGEPVTFTVTARDAVGNPVDAQVALAIVDKALLSLTEPNTVPIEAHFFPRQPLGVATSIPLSAYVEAQLIELVPDSGGGRGGGGGGGEAAGSPLREQFEDTAFWSATVRTGESGSTEVTVTMPDNLTTWVIDARGVTQETEVGQVQSEFQATLPLLIRPVTPRFLVEGDTALVSAVVNNNTGASIDATLTLEANGVSINGPSDKEVTIAAGGRQVIYWTVTADQQAETAEMIFRVQGGGFSDAARPAIGERGLLPIYRYETIETISTSGQLTSGGSRTEGIVVPPDLVTPSGELVVNLAPSLAGSTLDGLSYLKTYEFQSTDVVVSRFLPNAVTLLALDTFALDYPQFQQGLEGQIATALAQLESEQLASGAWGWVSSGERADLMTTAYAIEGLLTAQQAGYTVNQNMLTRALNWLAQANPADNPNLTPTQRLAQDSYRLYVLSLAERAPEGEINALYEQRDALPHYAVGFLALAINNSTGDGAQLAALQDQLTQAAVLDATGAHWAEEADDWVNWNTDTRSTAVILNAFAQIWPQSELIPNAVRWLMTARTADHWATPQETAWSVMALSRVMASTGELNPDYTWSLLVNGSQRLSGAANRDNAAASETITIPLIDLLAAGVTPLTVQRTDGSGRLYYNADLMLAPPVEQVEAVSRGITVTRRYLDADDNPVTGGTVGDELTVEITLVAERALHYLMFEDYFPAGAEGIDTTLLTESRLGQRDTSFEYGWGWWLFDSIQIRDEKALLVAEYLPAGTYQYTYRIRLTTPGEFHVIPTTAQQLYAPNVFGREAGLLFVIEQE